MKERAQASFDDILKDCVIPMSVNNQQGRTTKLKFRIYMINYTAMLQKDDNLYDKQLQLPVEQNVHSVHCADFYLRTSKKLNKYYFKLPDLHTQSWIFLMIPPPRNSHSNSSRWAPKIKTDRTNDHTQQPHQREHSIVQKNYRSNNDKK